MKGKTNQVAASPGGFTLIELLVVISIIGVLSSMMLPGLNRGKQKAIIVRCLGNLRQIGIGVQLYVDDYDSKFPLAYAVDPVDRAAKWSRSTLGGFDPRADQLPYYPSARGRALFDYVRPSEVYRCARDSGRRGEPCTYPVTVEPTSWQALGCSYEYNAGNLIYFLPGGFRTPPADEHYGMAGKREGWVPDPGRYILLHEPPARVYCSKIGAWYQWHYARSRTDFRDVTIAPAQFISPIAFVDGHASIHNFSKALLDIHYPYEATKDWIWYKPAK